MRKGRWEKLINAIIFPKEMFLDTESISTLPQPGNGACSSVVRVGKGRGTAGPSMRRQVIK